MNDHSDEITPADLFYTIGIIMLIISILAFDYALLRALYLAW